MWQTVAVYLSSLISLEFEHFRDRPASLEELLLRYLPVAVEVALTEAALHLTIDLLIVQRLALQEVLALCDAENGMVGLLGHRVAHCSTSYR